MEINEQTGIITLIEGDYGTVISFKIEGELLKTDILTFRIKENKNSETIVEITQSDLQKLDNNFILNIYLSKEQSEKLKAGDYIYGIDIYREDVLLKTLIAENKFEVVKGTR